MSAADIRAYIGSMADEIRHLEDRLASLKDAAVASVKRTSKRRGRKHSEGGDGPFPAEAKKARRKAPKKARKAVSPEVQVSRKLQGEYIRAIRSIAKGKRPFYQKIAKANGREAAIEAMKKVIGE